MSESTNNPGDPGNPDDGDPTAPDPDMTFRPESSAPEGEDRDATVVARPTVPPPPPTPATGDGSDKGVASDPSAGTGLSPDATVVTPPATPTAPAAAPAAPVAQPTPPADATVVGARRSATPAEQDPERTTVRRTGGASSRAAFTPPSGPPPIPPHMADFGAGGGPGQPARPASEAVTVPPTHPQDSDVTEVGTDTGLGMVGPYRLDEEVASNAAATVYKASDTRLHREVAVKVLHGAEARDPEFVEAFEKQAALMARLDSPHVMGVYTNGRTEDGDPYLVSQFAEGGDLGSLLKAKGTIPGPLAADICAQIADGLAAIHSREVGMVHGDVKPSNILLRDTNTPPHAYVSDVAASPEAAAAAGTTRGAWHYLSPERAVGAQPSPASDLYALGCLFYELVTGKPPYGGADGGADGASEGDSDGVAVKMAHASEPIPVLPGRDDFTLQANDLLSGQNGLLAKAPAVRLSDAVRARDRFAAMAERKMGFSSGATVTLKRAKTKWWVIGAAAAAVVVAGGSAVGITLTTTDPGTPAKPKPAVTGDITGDRKGDLVLGSPFSDVNYSWDDNTATVFASNGKGFDGGTTENLKWGSLLGDIDGDGREDVIQVSGRGSAFKVASNAKDHADANIQVPVSGKRLAMLCEDFDGDGRDDVAMISVGNGTKLPAEDADLGKLKDLKINVTVMTSQEDGTWAKSGTWFTGDWHGTTYDIDFAVGDLNGDKRADISMGGNERPPAVGVLLMSNGTKLTKVPVPIPGPDGDRNTGTAIFADVDGNGKDELVVHERTDIRVYSYDAGNTKFIHMPSWDIADPIDYDKANGSDIPAVADVNGDGRDDIVSPLSGDVSDDGNWKFLNEASVLLSGKDKFTAEKWEMPGADQFEIHPPLRNASNNNGTGNS